MRVIVDRFEGDFAVVELPNKDMVDMLKILLPINVKEGDIININIDDEGTKDRRIEMQKLMDSLRD